MMVKDILGQEIHVGSEVVVTKNMYNKGRVAITARVERFTPKNVVVSGKYYKPENVVVVDINKHCIKEGYIHPAPKLY